MDGFSVLQKIKEQINTVFISKEELINQILIVLISEGHLLLEDVPGVGKTTLVIALSKAIGSDFGRIQFTPDTLPSDVLGVSVYQSQTGEFKYMPGAIMHEVLLADEINRTSPKTQSGLLEAMEEGQVTVDGVVYPLKKPFMVIATQNPVEFIGTYPLPEAQLDRFMMKLSLGYPSKEDEMRLAHTYLEGKKAKTLEPVSSVSEILQIQKEVKQVMVHDDIISYILEIVEKTRNEERFILGASERGMLSLIRATQAQAYLEKRDYCIPDDVKKVVLPVLSHRLMLKPEFSMKNISSAAILKENYLKVKVPIFQEKGGFLDDNHLRNGDKNEKK